MTWEERWHPLREEWVIVAAHRQDRPWSGETVASAPAVLPEYVPDCYLCPGNSRVSGKSNPDYEQIFVFDNDHPSVSFDAPSNTPPPSEIYKARPATGIARVVCYSPRHDLTLTELAPGEIASLLKVWQQQYTELGSHPDVNHILIFENKGEAVGVSNPHPHCQIYANNFVFKTIENEARITAKYFKGKGRYLFEDIIEAERKDGRRIIAENESAIAFLPYFARYAYEVFVAPKIRRASIAAMTPDEIDDFGAVLKMYLSGSITCGECPSHM